MQTARPPNPSARLVRRYLECAAFVLLWMALEHYLHLSPLVGQLIGIPLIAGFQFFVARRPLVQLWVRDAEKLEVDKRTLALAAALALAAGMFLASVTAHPTAGRNLAIFALIVAGSVPAAFALRRQRATDLRRALPFVAAAVILRVGWYAAWHGGQWLFPAAKLLGFAATWVGEFVGCFVVDEVAFRGAFDPHLAAAGHGRLHAGCSAVFVSLLWSIWHLPPYNPQAPSFLALFAAISPFAVLTLGFGVLLSFAARRARTLAPTSAVHAFGNAYVLSFLK